MIPSNKYDFRQFQEELAALDRQKAPEPPPTQPITTSGKASASSSCAIASWPMTVWWSRTWFRTEPSE